MSNETPKGPVIDGNPTFFTTLPQPLEPNQLQRQQQVGKKQPWFEPERLKQRADDIKNNLTRARQKKGNAEKKNLPPRRREVE